MTCGIAALVLVLLAAPAVAQDTATAWPVDKRPIADTLSVLTEVTAVGLDLYHDIESQPARRWQVIGCDALKYGAVWGTVESLKRLAREERPDRSDFRSFPSAGAANAFAAVNGWKWGMSLSLSVGTGYLRTAANRHWLHDVFVGAVLGSLINLGVAQVPGCRGTAQ